MYSVAPVVTALGCYDSEGNFFQADQVTTVKEEMNQYRCVQYNNLIDTDNRINKLFYVSE